MQLKDLKNKKVYLLPKNDISIELNQYLNKKINFTNLGYLNNVKSSKDIEYLAKTDYIIISSPNYFKEIYSEIRKYIDKKKLLFSFKDVNNKVTFYRYISLYELILKYNKLTFNLSNINYIKLFKYKDFHKDRRAFIIGNGPSLKVEDLSKLENEITFAANKIYLAYETTRWRPTYYFVEDQLVYEQNFEDIKKQKGINFFPTSSLSYDRVKNGIYYDLIFERYNPHLPKFNNNALAGFYWGATVIYSMIQMAVYMGIKELYVIGVDFSFDVPLKDENTGKAIVSEGEVNHFHKDYRKVGEVWNQPQMDMQELSFMKIDEFCRKNDIKVYNASRNTKLEVLEKKDFESLFNYNKDDLC